MQTAAYQGRGQPGAAAAAAGRAAGVPVWIDAAQAVGHVASRVGATAVYGTSRKWLRGPRGVGFVVVDESVQQSLRQPIGTYSSREARCGSPVGLARAVEDLWAAGVEETQVRLADVGTGTRAALSHVPGWKVNLHPEHHPTGAITTLGPRDGQDVTGVRSRLTSEHGVLVTASLPWRAPLEPISPPVDVADEDLDRLVNALAMGS
ncbi:MAG: aminotransferase class V-fold PLP-dependent enzyme [Actinomycetota bacterium]|nr:aminotransferase class V-fold PLP-dependent enzyme [Actinomycetota bacterium]